MAVDPPGSNPFQRVHGGDPRPRPTGAGRSQFGIMTESKKLTAPMHSFGNTNRDQAGKVFLSSAHVAVETKGRTGPGAIYKVPGAMDAQVSSMKLTSPSPRFSTLERTLSSPPKQWAPPPGQYETRSSIGMQVQSQRMSSPEHSFGRTTRGQAHKVFLSANHIREQLGTQGPDPGHYVLPSAVGPQASSQRASAPSWSLGKTDRLKAEYESMRASLPPPGAYETWASIGKQQLSTSRTMPSYGFGSSTWGKEEKRFLTLGHTRTWVGTGSPANYDHQTQANVSSFGRQVLSSRESPPRAGFGSGPKLVFKTNDVPGPGHY